MTRERQINIAASKYIEDNSVRGEVCISNPKDSFIEGADWADANPKSPWISVEKDLPCNHKELMVKDEKGRWETKRVLVRIQETDISSRSPYFADCMMSKWDGEENGFLWHLCSQGYITHWMPIPKLEEE